MKAQTDLEKYLTQLTQFQFSHPVEQHLHLILKMHTGLLVTSIGTGIILGRQAIGEPKSIVDLSQYGALDAGMSRQHARIFPDANGRIYVCDLGSANGTYLNEKRLPKDEWFLLHQDDILRLGKLFIQISFNDNVSEIWAEIVEKITTHEQKEIINSHLQRVGDCLHASIVTEMSSADIESYWHQLKTLDVDKTLENDHEIQPEVVKPELVRPAINPLPDFQSKPPSFSDEQSQVGTSQVGKVIYEKPVGVSHTGYQSPISVVIAHPDTLVHLGIKQVLTKDRSVRIIDGCSTLDDLFELFEKNPVIDVLLLSTALLEQMTTDQKSIVAILGGRTIAIGTEQQQLNQEQIHYLWGYLTQQQMLERGIPCIHTVHQGIKCFNQQKYDSEFPLSSYFNMLTDREHTALKYLASNHSTNQIASLMGVDSSIVETYRLNIMRKLKLNSKADLVLYALHNGIISLEE